jgi:hypothetical protein
MSCAEPAYFETTHIEKSRFSTSRELTEQAIHCLELVSELVDAGLDFQFKGGNSLLLLLDPPARFSIDVDIATDENRFSIEQCLDRLIARHQRFVRWEPRRHTTKPWLPIASYYLYFRSVTAAPGEGSIMLDVQLRRSPYATRRVPVACGALYRCNTLVEAPLAASLIADKLLTIGPRTLGIPFGKGKEAQRLKHVFDIARLSETGPGLGAMRDAFHGCLEHENQLQERAQSPEAVMRDTLRYCGATVECGEQPQPGPSHEPALRENSAGLEAFSRHLFAAGYAWRHLRRDCARAAVCIAAVVDGSVREHDFREALELASCAHCDDPARIERAVAAAWQSITHWIGENPLIEPAGGAA